MHIPVLQNEVLEYLAPKPNDNFIDCTLNGGGHTKAILEKTAPKGKVLGIDADPEIIRNLKLEIRNLEKRIIPVCDNFANLKEIIKQTKFGQVSGILFDLGMSSWQLEESGRGFSYRASGGSEGKDETKGFIALRKKEPLDMRYSILTPLTAEKILNYWSVAEIEKVLREYGEERFSSRIAQRILEERKVRPISNTSQLVEIIRQAVPPKFQHQKIHLATRTFQALRIQVNDELNNLKNALPQAAEALSKGGRLAVISFHSLEDRIVKNFFKSQELKILTKKPITPGFKEIKINSRARSAKLRAAEKI